MVRVADRDMLRGLLKLWQVGALSVMDLYCIASDLSDILDRDLGDIYYIPELPEEDPRSIAAEVLGILDTAVAQSLRKADIPVFLEFLDTPPGEELQAWKKWGDYWDHVDFEAREREEREEDGGAS